MSFAGTKSRRSLSVSSSSELFTTSALMHRLAIYLIQRLFEACGESSIEIGLPKGLYSLGRTP